MAKKKKIESASEEDAQKMVENGEAEIPAEAIVSESQESSSIESDFNLHPKFAKFKKEKG